MAISVVVSERDNVQIESDRCCRVDKERFAKNADAAVGGGGGGASATVDSTSTTIDLRESSVVCFENAGVALVGLWVIVLSVAMKQSMWERKQLFSKKCSFLPLPCRIESGITDRHLVVGWGGFGKGQ